MPGPYNSCTTTCGSTEGFITMHPSDENISQNGSWFGAKKMCNYFLGAVATIGTIAVSIDEYCKYGTRFIPITVLSSGIGYMASEQVEKFFLKKGFSPNKAKYLTIVAFVFFAGIPLTFEVVNYYVKHYLTGCDPNSLCFNACLVDIKNCLPGSYCDGVCHNAPEGAYS